MGQLARDCTPDPYTRCLALGLQVSRAQWDALPAAARARLALLPSQTGVERAAFVALVGWLLATFPPGWRDPASGRDPIA
ncbi:MAG: hypothetical protein K8H88_33850 [Sandaracinaceae bacterium]|nr:hypothetical protein [Sandaracinaceae bacterium]